MNAIRPPLPEGCIWIILFILFLCLILIAGNIGLCGEWIC
jgi:hypothetical protein